MKKDLMTRLTHLGVRVSPSASVPKIPPIYMSAAYCFDDAETAEEVSAGRKQGHAYGRVGNPTNDCLREILADIDDGESAQVYSTGMAAIAMVLLAHVKLGDHIIAHNVLFGGTYAFLKQELEGKYGVEVTLLDLAKADLEPHLKPNTKIVYVETITNPLMDVVDIRAISETAHRHGCRLVVDNTFATPVVCQPLTLGADIAVYSATKFMSGHSDILGGVVVSSNATIERISRIGRIYGPTMSPFDAWLLIRSLRTLQLRVTQHSRNALRLAEYFEHHGKIERVLYPGLTSSPGHPIASRLFNNGLYGGVLTVDLGTERRVRDFVRSSKMARLVPSLGSFSTSVCDTKSSHVAMSAEERRAMGLSDGMLRFSVGLESIDDLIEDFDTVLTKV